MSKRLSALVITKNEAKVLARCLTSLAFTDEIIVVDAESTDATRDIAKRFGAQVYTNPWRGYGEQRNFGLSKASGDWVVVVDADEEVSAGLADQITTILKQPTVDFYWLRVITIFLDTPLSHLYGHNLRLFKKTAGHYAHTSVHEQVVTKAGHPIPLGSRHSAVILEPLLHYSHQTIASYLQKMHRYTTLDANDMVRRGRHRSGRVVRPSKLLPYYLSLRQLFKLLFYRRGLLDGFAGIVWCGLSAYYEYEMAQKFLAGTKNVRGISN